MGNITKAERERRAQISSELPEEDQKLSTEKDAASVGQSELIGLFRSMLSQLSADNRETMLAAIAEMKKPDPEAQAKLDAERERSMALTLARVENAKNTERKRAETQATCRHAMPNGKTRLRGAVLSNGYARAFCPECHWESEPFKALQHELTAPIDIGSWGSDAAFLVRQRIATSEPPPPIADLPYGARIEF